MSNLIQELLEAYEIDFKIMDGYDDCILGVAERFGSDPHIVYDKVKVLNKLVSQGMSLEEAHEYYEFNMVGAYVGENTPSFVNIP